MSTRAYSASPAPLPLPLPSLSSNTPQVRSDEATVSTLDQRYVLTAHGARLAAFVTLLDTLDADKSKIVFVGRRDTCAQLAEMLRSLQHKCVALHGRLVQRERLSALNRFKSGDVNLLIATGAGPPTLFVRCSGRRGESLRERSRERESVCVSVSVCLCACACVLQPTQTLVPHSVWVQTLRVVGWTFQLWSMSSTSLSHGMLRTTSTGEMHAEEERTVQGGSRHPSLLVARDVCVMCA